MAAEDDDFPSRLGRAIRLRRTALGLKRRELAEAAELSYPYISEIENGSKEPSRRAIGQVAAALDLSTADLLEFAEQIPSEPDPTSSMAESLSLSSRSDRRHQASARSIAPVTITPDEAPEGSAGPTYDRLFHDTVAAIVRAELHAWARTELPSLVRDEIERALRETDLRNG